jgi:hypothetical protein
MATFYEVQELTSEGWLNTWNSPDNWGFYNSKEEAQGDLSYYLKAFNMSKPQAFRIVEVEDSIALKGL